MSSDADISKESIGNKIQALVGFLMTDSDVERESTNLYKTITDASDKTTVLKNIPLQFYNSYIKQFLKGITYDESYLQSSMDKFPNGEIWGENTNKNNWNVILNSGTNIGEMGKNTISFLIHYHDTMSIDIKSNRIFFIKYRKEEKQNYLTDILNTYVDNVSEGSINAIIDKVVEKLDGTIFTREYISHLFTIDDSISSSVSKDKALDALVDKTNKLKQKGFESIPKYQQYVKLSVNDDDKTFTATSKEDIDVLFKTLSEVLLDTLGINIIFYMKPYLGLQRWKSNMVYNESPDMSANTYLIHVNIRKSFTRYMQNKFSFEFTPIYSIKMDTTKHSYHLQGDEVKYMYETNLKVNSIVQKCESMGELNDTIIENPYDRDKELNVVKINGNEYLLGRALPFSNKDVYNIYEADKENDLVGRLEFTDSTGDNNIKVIWKANYVQ